MNEPTMKLHSSHVALIAIKLMGSAKLYWSVWAIFEPFWGALPFGGCHLDENF
jgi:hypothetical protein